MILLLLFFACASRVFGENYIVYVILGQENKFNLKFAKNLREDIRLQNENIGENSTVYLSHEDFSHPGGWTILPLLPELFKIHSSDNSAWIVFLDESTNVKVDLLKKLLLKYNHSEDIWIGHALVDRDATIIHHFAFHENPSSFKYPNIASGVAISMSLVKKLAHRITEIANSLPDFNIDRSHELALFVWDRYPGISLTDEPSFCITDAPDCVSYVHQLYACDNLISNEGVYYAIKTCEKFHQDRIPVVKNTWGRHANILKFFSNSEDKTIPTVHLNVPNTQEGHCEKTMAILRYVAEEIDANGTNISWIVIVDDDTILSVSRLHRLLSCFDPTELVALGERYGYNVAHTPPRGYNYITGGGGMVFSRPLVTKLMDSCKCPRPNAPDDMYLGACMSGLGVEVTHAAGFHQARPPDYAPGYLQSHQPISFHKHWMIKADQVYREWFEEEDAHFTEEKIGDVHNEL